MSLKSYRLIQLERARVPALLLAGAILSSSQATLAASAADEADWQSRSTGSGVFYLNTFDFNDSATMRSASYQGMNFPERGTLETTNNLSGKGALRCAIPKESNEGTCNWAHSWHMPVGNQAKTIVKKTFYYQFQIYLPKYILDHRFATVGGTANVAHKFAIIQEPDASFSTGEVVITNDSFRSFVTAYRLRASNSSADGFNRKVDNSPCNTPDYIWQTAIDAGPQSSGGQTDATSCALFKRRYGPVHYAFSGTNKYGGGTLTQQGNPDPDAAQSGAVWAADDWNVIEVFVDETTNTVKLWHARRGGAPKLVYNEVGSADLGHRAGNYTGVQLLPRLEELASDSSRQDTYAIYDEIIASSQFIPFPKQATVRPNPPTNVTAQ
jgi:hypothetical protein